MSDTSWFVMTHFDMKRFREWLKAENARRMSEERPLIEPFYPSDFLKDAVSNDLSNFVFLKATTEDVDRLVNDSYNKLSANRLRYYLDTDRRSVTVSDTVMQDFLKACIDYGGRIEIAPPISSIEVQDRVKIISGPFTGYEATVSGVRLQHGVLHLDLSIHLVYDVMNIRMSGVSKKQIQILNRTTDDAIRTDFIEYTQNHLLRILNHRVRRASDPTTLERDADMLARIYRYRYYEIKNDSARYHFLALMLISAHLCRYKADEVQLRQQALAAIDDIQQRSAAKAATDTRAYLWIALYISTHDPVYRDAAKKYVQNYQPKSTKLRSFVSLIRTGRKI